MECRFCKTELHHVFVDLFNSPASNSFVQKGELNEPEIFFPLKVYTCHKCFLVQVDEYKKSDAIFTNEYVYFSSYSTSWLDHSKKYVDLMTNRFGLSETSQVMEIASNDGYLLQYFKNKGIPVLGIEPTANTAKVAIEMGIESLIEFFGTELATKLNAQNRKADLLLGNNVLAHVPDIVDFVAGMKIVFKNNYTQRPNDTNDDAIKGSISYNDRDVEHDILFPDFTYLTNKIADCLERKKIRKNTNCKKLTKLDTNEMSVVMNISHGENNLLLTGDASKEVERYVYENYQDIFADWRGTTNDSHELTQDEQSKGESILKLGHHGSKTSTDPYVVGKLLPKYAVSSSVINNKFSHPDVSVLETVQEVGAEILRTDLLGSVNMVSNGEVWLQK